MDVVALVAALLILAPDPVADRVGPPSEREQFQLNVASDVDTAVRWRAASNAGAFVLGMWSSALAHELGHATVAWASGTRFSWPTSESANDPFLPYWRVPDDTSIATRRNIAMGAYIFTTAVEETIVHTGLLPRNDWFLRGFIVYDAVNTVGYVVRDVVSVAQGDSGVGDIRDMHRGGIPREAVYVVLLAHAVWETLELFIFD